MTACAPGPGIRCDRADEVVRWAEEFSVRQAASVEQISLLARAFGGLRSQLKEADHPLCIPVPLAVYAAITGDAGAAVPVAAAATMLYLGVDIFDDVADGDLPGHWDGCSAAEANLAAATLFAAMPPLVIAELDTAPETRSAMQRTLAMGLVQMAAGQQMDMALRVDEIVSTENVELSVSHKSGAEIGMFARLAALFAGATSDVVESCGLLGTALGTAGQLASDCYDLFETPKSRDLANSTRTWPIASHLGRLGDTERGAFLELLEAARTDAAAQETVRQRLRAAGELRRCAFTIEIYVQRARRALRDVGPVEPGSSMIEACLSAISVLSAGRAQHSAAIATSVQDAAIHSSSDTAGVTTCA